ncbi:MAG: septum formation initiator family protein [Bacteroidia bacterium]|jgi:cell division protein FtsB|nr:septum formation initiator family protein [Bacteroidia bacterium]
MKWILNRYFLTAFFFVIWLLFFDKNDIFTQKDLSKQLKRLYEEKRYYKTEIEKNNLLIEEFKNNIESIERFAREQYWMKKDNEEVYIVETRKN